MIQNHSAIESKGWLKHTVINTPVVIRLRKKVKNDCILITRKYPEVLSYWIRKVHSLSFCIFTITERLLERRLVVNYDQ